MNLDALDTLDRARALIDLAMMACREGGEELNPVYAGLSAACEHLERTASLIGGPGD